MLLQELIAYADRASDGPPPGYQKQPIRYLITVSPDGKFLGMTDTLDKSSPATRKGVERQAPQIKRRNVVPKLLADDALYVLGVGGPDDTSEQALEKIREKHTAFCQLVDACAAETGDELVRAVAEFLQRLPDHPVALPDKFDPKAMVTFRIGENQFPIDRDAVRRFWARHSGAGQEDADDTPGKASGPRLPCVICGRVRPVLKRHPVSIKGGLVPGGQSSGVDLISADKAAFESYGLENSLIAPTCDECARKYANALNDLLANDQTRLRMPPNVFLFWTARGDAVDFLHAVTVADPEEVRKLLTAHFSAKREALIIDDTAFFALGLTAAGARLAVRSWITTTVGNAEAHLAHYFRLQRMIDAATGAMGEPVSLNRLVKATVRDPLKDEPNPTVPAALIALAVGGYPLADDVLFQAVRRCRAGQGVTYARAVLIRMVLSSKTGLSDEEIDAMSELDHASTNQAYLCGRLLAILDEIQRRAISPKATLVDRFYGTASSAPATVYGSLLRNARNHLAKLRKDSETGAAQIALERRLTDVMDKLYAAGGFPTTLNLKDQGWFALGFYHQKADDQRQIAERRAAKAAGAAEATDDLANIAG